jgi:hypothetical protein
MDFERLSDLEIEEEVRGLTPFQKAMYDSALKEDGDFRHALFVAKTWPDNYSTD